MLSGAPLPPPLFLAEALQAINNQKCFDIMSAHYLGLGNKESKTYNDWAEFFRQRGEPLQIINSEDMHWSSAGKNNPAKLAVASALIQLHVHEAAKGVIRTFGFCYVCLRFRLQFSRYGNGGTEA